MYVCATILKQGRAVDNKIVRVQRWYGIRKKGANVLAPRTADFSIIYYVIRSNVVANFRLLLLR